jgi:hypothetical protein
MCLPNVWLCQQSNLFILKFNLLTVFIFFSLRRPFALHLVERFFKQIIECSDVGVDLGDEGE